MYGIQDDDVEMHWNAWCSNLVQGFFLPNLTMVENLEDMMVHIVISKGSSMHARFILFMLNIWQLNVALDLLHEKKYSMFGMES